MTNAPTPLATIHGPTGHLRAHAAGYDQGSCDDHVGKAGEGADLGQATSTFWLTIHQHLRGRYPLAIILGVLLGPGVAAIVCSTQRPNYHSEGIVRIAYSLPEVMQRTDQNEPMAMFDTVMSSQRMLITSRRVVDTAIHDPIWKATGRPVPRDPDQYFSSNLRVESKARSEFIQVIVTDPDPSTAAAAVTSIINAYAALYNSQEAHLEQQRIGLLEDRQHSVQSRVQELNELLRTGAQEYGTTRLDLFYEGAAARLARIEEALADVTAAMATAPGGRTELPGSPADVANSPAALTVEQIAANDGTMRGYLDKQLRAEAEMGRLSVLGLGNTHKSMVVAKWVYDQAKAHADRYAETYRAYQTVTGHGIGDPGGPVATAGKSPDALRADEARLTKIRNQVKAEMVQIGTKRANLDQQSIELGNLQKELEKLANRIDLLRGESSLGGRLSIITSGETPLSPDANHRILFSAGSGVVGGLLPAVLLFFISFVKRRYRYCADTEADVLSKHISLLGIVPELSSTTPTREGMMMAANSLHQIRMSLQTQAPSQGANVYLVTSATAGEGKTTLTVALGLSFAASRARTLIIDADLVGRSLTNTAGEAGEEGFHEAVQEGSINGRIRRMECGPYILTAGKASAADACTLPIQTLRSLLNEARQQFAVIVIDSGPILGSLEAAILAPLVDGVIVAISRGQERHLLERAMLRLNALRANVVGCIFNRATQNDYNHSQYASSAKSKSTGTAGETLSNDATRRLARFGPLVQSVAVTMPASRN